MSIIHLNQIKNQICKTFDALIDMSDQKNNSASERENYLLTRSLAAYALYYQAAIPPEIAAKSITDGGEDNGIDAIYHDESNKRLYIVQSKWIHSGSGQPDNGDVKKFVSGVHDLFNLKFERFNRKVADKEAEITSALSDPGTRYDLLLVYTGTALLSKHSMRDLGDLLSEMNDTSEVVFANVLNQAELYKSLTSALAGSPIDLQITFREWGKKTSPREAIYGQVTGDQVASWWSAYRGRLLAKNLRSVLGDTDVNEEMRDTINNRPEDFWYFNNGITIIAKEVTRSMVGGTGNDHAVFHCKDISIVNGAQTVGSIGRFSEIDSEKLSNLVIQVRIIVRGDDESFGELVTKTNNRQNRIENRDFVSLDPEQSRLRNELLIDGIDYQVMRGESVIRAETSFDLVDATSALACASGKARLAVQLKREISKLWEDIRKAPYKEIFNPSISGVYVWRCVQIQRFIDKILDQELKEPFFQYKAIAVHGNRIVSALVFSEISGENLKDTSFDFTAILKESFLKPLVIKQLTGLIVCVDKDYPNAIIPTLFKNLKKCEALMNKVQALTKNMGV